MSRERETSRWVEIDSIVPHPRNPNRMTDADMDKLDLNIGDREYPPLIVRDLEQSQEFAELHAEGKLQLIDGEHRWRLMKRRGAKLVEVRVWHDVTDERAWQLLLTMNRIHGQDDPKRRAELVRDFVQATGDIEAAAQYLPEDAEAIQRLLDQDTQAEVADATERAAKISSREPLTIFCEPEQAEAIRATIKQWLEANDPDHNITDCREGYALQQICDAFTFQDEPT